MNDKKYFLNMMLAFVLGAYYLVLILVQTFAPQIITPKLGVPELMGLSLTALLLDHYLAPGAERCYICIPLVSAITFGALTAAVCTFVGLAEALRLTVLGCVVFTAATWLFSSALDRLASGPAAKAAPVVSAVGLYLASQCLMGMV